MNKNILLEKLGCKEATFLPRKIVFVFWLVDEEKTRTLLLPQGLLCVHGMYYTFIV